MLNHQLTDFYQIQPQMIVFKPHDVFRFTPEIMKSIDGIRKAEITQEVALEGPDLFLFLYSSL